MRRMEPEARIVSINRGTVAPLVTARGEGPSAIVKTPVDGPVAVRSLGLDGDEQADHRVHGGPTRAVYVYASEDLAWWSAQLGRSLPPGFIGENVTTAGVDVNGLRAGDELRMGTAVLRVAAPRLPCFKLAARVGLHGFEKTFARALRTGVYCSVEREGVIAAGDTIAVDARGDGPPTRDVVAAKYGVDVPLPL